MPYLIKKEKKKQELINTLDEVFHRLATVHQVSEGDFPRVKSMQTQLANTDFSQLAALKPRLIEIVDAMLTVDIPILLQMIPQVTIIDL